MEYSPPPLFKQGAPARVKVIVFAFISIALLVLDARFNALTVVRQVTGTLLYPLQMAAMVPRDAARGVGAYFTSVSTLQQEVNELKSRQVASAQKMQQAEAQLAEIGQLRRLLGAREQLPVKSIMAEILYDARDPSTRRIVLDRGSRDGVALGQPVIDGYGVVGQVTRVFPLTAEVTLLTDRDQAIPVQVLRTGLRSVAYGGSKTGMLDLRFAAPNTDIKIGDVLVTSGLDGVYPAGLAVARVAKVEHSVAGAFGTVLCAPMAGIDRYRQLLVLTQLPERAPRPGEPAPVPTKRSALPAMAPVNAPAWQAPEGAAGGLPPGPLIGTTPPPAPAAQPVQAPQAAAVPSGGAQPAATAPVPAQPGAARPLNAPTAVPPAVPAAAPAVVPPGVRAPSATNPAPPGARATQPQAPAASPAPANNRGVSP